MLMFLVFVIRIWRENEINTSVFDLCSNIFIQIVYRF